MSIIDYQESETISQGLSFRAMIMAAMRKADSNNLTKLQEAFPDILEELRARYNAPGGALNEQEMEFVMRRYEKEEEEEEDTDND